ncbi:MAG: hypothetical protein EXX96DRAFT_620088 [Benjaminiella poitrasii]|nr:MAG: hypothetical protein EXX96DRAFT_620088 [Benjaminiella poitrasii]
MSNRENFYKKLSEDLQDALNYGFRRRPSLLQAVAKLHTGLIVVDKSVILILVAEAYGRAKSIDVNAETNFKSLPHLTNSTVYHSSLCAGIFEEADGHAIKNKLKIGSKYMNVLSTLSVNLNHDRRVDIGPSTSASIKSIQPSSARIFYRQDCVKEFFEAFNNQSYAFPSVSISSLRQVSTGYNDCSTFAPWRAAIDEIDYDCLIPTTVFTWCVMPHNEALAIFRAAAKVREISRKDNSKDWGTLVTFATALEKKFIEHADLQALTVAMMEDFNCIARIIANRLSDSNIKQPFTCEYYRRHITEKLEVRQLQMTANTLSKVDGSLSKADGALSKVAGAHPYIRRESDKINDAQLNISDNVRKAFANSWADRSVIPTERPACLADIPSSIVVSKVLHQSKTTEQLQY